MANVTVYIREDYTRKDGTNSLYAKFYIQRQSVKIPMDIYVKPEEWDKEKQRVRGNSKQSRDQNLIISKQVDAINNVFVRFRLQQKTITKEEFFKEYTNPTIYVDFWDFMEREIKSRRGNISENTFRGQMSTVNKLRELVPNLQPKDITEDVINDMQKGLKKIKNGGNTIHKNMVTLKTYISKAIRKKLMEHNPFDVVKLHRHKAERLWLTEEELLNLIDKYNKEWLKPNLHKVLGYFLFSCFTGFRLSDVNAFCLENVVGEFIVLRPVKTKNVNSNIVTIPLTDPIRMLIKKVAPHRVRGSVFETYSDQKTNEYLKDIADMCGIDKALSFHSARHTFATYFLSKTNDVATLQRLLGHASIADTMIYVHISEEKKVAQMHTAFDGITIRNA
ncbi:MAG TPA: site-specific integrase [Williamwhitmania sp.]|nr:site-specific integrase [Williamwhitmania sp.]